MQFPAISTFGSQCGGKQLFLTLGQKQILKPFSQRQYEFYEWVKNIDNPQAQQSFIKIIPKYFGKYTVQPTMDLSLSNETTSQWVKHLIQDKYSIQKDKQHYLVLENLLNGMLKPSILDLKIGIRVKNQKFRQKLMNSTTPTLNFRMCGVKVYQPKKNKSVFKDKYYHQTIGDDKVALNLAHFFYDGQKLNIQRINNTIQQVNKISQIYKQLEGVKIQSLSLFLAYDGSKEDGSIVAKLIDYDLFFKTDQNQIDQNRLKGLNNIQVYLKQILLNLQQITEAIQQRDDL